MTRAGVDNREPQYEGRLSKVITEKVKEFQSFHSDNLDAVEVLNEEPYIPEEIHPDPPVAPGFVGLWCGSAIEAPERTKEEKFVGTEHSIA